VLHGVICQRTGLFITIAVRTSTPALWNTFSRPTTTKCQICDIINYDFSVLLAAGYE
jgi:hypothetical protein